MLLEKPHFTKDEAERFLDLPPLTAEGLFSHIGSLAGPSLVWAMQSL